MTLLSREEILQRVRENEASKAARYFTLVLAPDGRVFIAGYVGMGESEAIEMSEPQAAVVKAMLEGKDLVVDSSRTVSYPLMEFEERNGVRHGLQRGRYARGHVLRSNALHTNE